MQKGFIILFGFWLALSIEAGAQVEMDSIDIQQFAGKTIPRNLLNDISIDFDDVPFEVALNEISAKGQVHLSFNRDLLPLKQSVSAHLEDVMVLEALLTVLKKTGTMLQVTQNGTLAIINNPQLSSEQSTSRRIGANIVGTVRDAVTKEPLPGANVFIEGTNRGAATNVEGEYIIPKVPPGHYTLIVKYIGYTDTSMPIYAEPGATVTQNIELAYVEIKGETVEITAQAEGQIAAINQQLSSRTITNVVAADRIQEIPDVNAAESVARLPGISIIRDGGEGQKVAIRGMAPKYNIMQVNGVRMQSTDPKDRSVDLNMISSNILSGIEVTKVVTADMDADAVGGTVNLKIGKAKTGFHSNFSMQGGYGSIAETYGNYKFTGLVSNRFFNDKLGIQLAASIDKFDRSSDALSADYETNEEETKNQGLTVIDLKSVTITDTKTTRNRKGGGLILDYELPYGTLLFSNFISNLASDSVSMFNSLAVQGSQFNSWTKAGDGNKTTVYSNALQGEFQLSDLKMDFSLSNSVSKQDMPGDLHMRVIPEQDQAGFKTVLLDKAVSATPSQFLNSITIYRGRLRTKRLENLERNVKETERNAVINFSVPYYFTSFMSGNFKFGGKYRYNKRENDETQYWINPDRHMLSQVFTHMMKDSLWTDLGLELDDTGNGIRAVLFEDPNYDIGNFLAGKEGVDKFFYTGSIDKMEHYEALATKYGYFFKDPQYSNQNDYTYKGNLSAFYVMTEMNLGKYILFMPGIRYENLETDYIAFETTYYGPEWYNFYNEEVTSKRKKEHWFPQIHLRIKPFDWFDIRLASTRTIIYPDYRAFSPYYYYASGSPSIALGNTELKHAIAQNYDAYTSLYNNYIGLFTCGYFYKEIDDLISDFKFQTKDPAKINYRIEGMHPTKNTRVDTWINLDSKTYVRGIELDWQTNFWYFPSVLRGLVLYINYTYMRSETRYPFQILVKQGTGIFAKSTLVDTTRVVRMPHQPNDILNTTVGYDFRGFSARLSFVFQGNVLGRVAGREELDSFTDDLYLWDLIVNQKLPWDGFELYCNIKNMTNRPDRNYTSKLKLLSYAGYYGRNVDFGMRYKF